MKDVELLVSNATTFNEEDSTVYQVRGLLEQNLSVQIVSPSSRML